MFFDVGCCAGRAEKWALSAWSKFNLVVPVDLPLLSDYLGVEIVREAMPPDVPGFYLDSGYHKRIYLNINHRYERRRFTLAHEIGHAAMASVPCPQNMQTMFHITAEWRPDCHELFCDRFAAELLMPRPLMMDMCRELHHPEWGDKTDVLASRFQVSVSAMRVRLRELGLECQKRRYQDRRAIAASW